MLRDINAIAKDAPVIWCAISPSAYVRILDGMHRLPPSIAHRLSRAGQLTEPRALTTAGNRILTALDRKAHAELIIRHDDAGLTTTITAPVETSVGVAGMADSLAARADRIEEQTSLDAAVIATVRVRRGKLTGRDTTAGADPTETARVIADVLPDGAWIGVSIRPQRAHETRRLRSWFDAQLDASVSRAQHHSGASHGSVSTITIGAGSISDAKLIARSIMAALPGWDVATTVRRVRRPPVMPIVAVALVAYLATLTGRIPLGAGVVVSSILAVLALLLATDRLPTRALRIRRALAVGRLPAPASSSWLMGMFSQSAGYPLATHLLPLAAMHVGAIAAPHAGAATGAATTLVRATPPALRQPIGPRIGIGSDGYPVHLSAADRYAGVMVWGAPGTGKSVAIRGLWAADLATRQPTSTMIAIETKDGAGRYVEHARRAGVEPIVIEATGDTPSIELLGHDAWTPVERARHAVTLLTTAFPAGGIMSKSAETLTALIAAGLVVTPEMAAEAAVAFDSPIQLAHLLSTGSDAAKRLAAVILQHGGDADAQEWARLRALGTGAPASGSITPIGQAAERLAQFYGPGVSDSRRSNDVDAPRNKLDLLVQAPGWWHAYRPRYRLEDLVVSGQPIIINFGAPITGTGSHLDEEVSTVLATMTMSALQSAIKRCCQGGEAAGRTVSIYADELAEVARYSEAAVTWLREQGRAYGVRLTLGTQRSGQLPVEVRASVGATNTQMYMQSQDPTLVAQAVADLEVAEPGQWTSASISSLPRYTAIVRTSVDGVRQPAVQVALDDSETWAR